MHYDSKLVPVTINPSTRISFRNRITNMLLASCNAREMWLRKQFFTYWKDGSIPNIKKQNRRTDKYDRLRWFLSLSLLHLLLLHEEYKSASSVTELRYRMFTEKNLFSGDRSPSTLDALVFAEHSYFFWTILLGVRNPPPSPPRSPPRKKPLWPCEGSGVGLRLG